MSDTPFFQVDGGWRAFQPHPSRPEFVLPAGSVDAHCHVFGPGEQFPYASERKYTPCDAPKERLWALRNFLGFERNVVVQATCHGSENRALVDALQHANGRARGVVTLARDSGDAELHDLNAAGVRGVRFNFVKRLADASPMSWISEIAARIKPLGWHCVIYFEAADLSSLYDFISELPTIVVVDHIGRPDVGLGAYGSEFNRFVRLMHDNDNVWTKVSCPDRLSLSGPPDYDDVVPFARRIVEAFPDRVLWGTDWPHPNLKTHMPDDGKLVDFIPRIARTAELQRKLLIDNPRKLYWPEELI